MRLSVLLLLLAAACGGTPPPATPADAQRANVALAELERGRTLLIQKCRGCHRPPVPSERPASDWPHEVGEMAERSKVDADEQRAIALYLVTLAQR